MANLHRPGLEPAGGRDLPALAEGRGRARSTTAARTAYVDALREGHAAAGRGLLVAHALRRATSSSCRTQSTGTTLSQRNALVANPDGSIDFYIQAESPGKGARRPTGCRRPGASSSWCCGCTARRSAPPTIVDGSWTPPPVRRGGQDGSGAVTSTTTRRQERMSHDQGRRSRRESRQEAVRCSSLAVLLVAGILGRGYLQEGRAWYYGLQAYLYGFPLVMMDLTKDAGDGGADRRRDHGPDQPVRRHDEVPGRLVPGGPTDRARHAVRDAPGPISTRSRWCCRCRTRAGATTSSRCSTCGATSSRRSASATPAPARRTS